MQATTIHGDDATLALAAQATQMGLNVEQTEKMIQVSADLGAANGKGLEPSFKTLQAAMAGSTTQLERMFPAQAEMIRNVRNMDEILEIVGDRVAGQAADQFKTFEGQIKATNNSFTEIQKVFGFAITQNEDVLKGFLDLNVVLEQVRQFVDANKDSIAALVSFGMRLLIASLEIAVSSITGFVNLIQENIDWVKALSVGLAFTATALGTYTAAINAAAIAKGLLTVATVAWSTALKLTPIGLIVGGLTLLGAAVYQVYQNWDEFTATIKIWSANMIDTVLPAIEFVLNGFASLASIFSKDMADSIRENIKNIQNQATKLRESGEATRESIRVANEKIASDKSAAKAAQDSAEDTISAAEDVTEAKIELRGKDLEDLRKFEAEIDAIQAERRLKEEELRLMELSEQEINDSERLQNLIESLGREEAVRQEARLRMLEQGEQTIEVVREQARIHEEIETKKIENQIKQRQKEADDHAKYLEEKEKREREAHERELKLIEEAQKSRDEEFNVIKIRDREKDRWDKSTWNMRMNRSREGMNALVSLQNSGSKEMFAVGKTAAIAQATINTFQAATGAYASLAAIPVVGPALGAAAAAAAVIAGLANVREIQAQRFQHGGIVGGTSYFGDKVPARVNSGELILNRAQQGSIANQLTGSNMAEVVEELRGLRADIRSLELRIGDDDILNSVNRELNAGRRLAIGQ